MSTENEQRLGALEEAQGRNERAMAEVIQRVGAAEDSNERLWEAIETDRGNTARLLHRVDRLEGAFESQWAVLRRLELEALETRKDMQVGFREMRSGFATIGAKLATST